MFLKWKVQYKYLKKNDPSFTYICTGFQVGSRVSKIHREKNIFIQTVFEAKTILQEMSLKELISKTREYHNFSLFGIPPTAVVIIQKYENKVKHWIFKQPLFHPTFATVSS